MEWEHLLLLTNAQRYSKAALARGFFFPHAKLLLGFGSSLGISNTSKVSNSVLKYLCPVADLSESQEQPFLLADADAGNS